MKSLVAVIAMMLMVSAIAIPIGLSHAEMPEQAQGVLANLENFGMEVSNFVHDAMASFHDQKLETVAQIKECRANMRDAEPSEREQVRQECRSNLDEIRDSYKEIRSTFHETFKEFRDSISVLRADIKGEHVSDEQRQAAIDDITDSAKEKHQMQGKGNQTTGIDELRQKMMSSHKKQ